MAAEASQPTLTGKVVRLRPFRNGDVDALWAMVNDEEGNRLTGTHTRFTRAAVEQWYATRAQQTDRLDLAIATRDDDACVGEAVLLDLDAENASCAVRISLVGPAVYGRGYGTEALTLLLDHAFTDLGLHRVELEVYDMNHRARRVYEKLGFVVEGARREALLWDGTYHDAIIMGLLAREWRQHRAG